MFKYIKFKKVPTEYTVLEFTPKDEKTHVNFFTGVNVVSIEGEKADIDELISAQDARIRCEEITKDEFKALVENTPQVGRIRQIVKESFDADMAAIAKKYPLYERETWPIQLAQAKRYQQSGDEADAPFLKTLADADGSTVADFADAVIQKAAGYEDMAAAALAKKRARERELLAKIGL